MFGSVCFGPLLKPDKKITPWLLHHHDPHTSPAKFQGVFPNQPEKDTKQRIEKQE